MASSESDSRSTALVPVVPNPVVEYSTPRSDEAERSILGACLLGPGVYREASEVLSGEELYLPRHRTLWKAISALVESKAPLDLVTLCDYLDARKILDRIGGIEFVMGLMEHSSTAASVVHWANIVKERHLRRLAIAAATDLIRSASDIGNEIERVHEEAAKALISISARSTGIGYRPTHDIIYDGIARMRELRDTKTGRGFKTGLVTLDAMTGGIFAEELVILAARPSVGKTALALTLMLYLSMWRENPVPGLFFSVEMGEQSLFERMMAMVSGIPSDKIRDMNFAEAMFPAFDKAATDLMAAKLHIDTTSGIQLHILLARARRAKLEHNIQYVVVDYLQLIETPASNGEPETVRLGKISRALKALSKELKIPVIALCQLSRKHESEGRKPDLTDLRGSGEIEQDADQVWMLWRQFTRKSRGDEDTKSFNPSETEVYVRKNRNGATGDFRLIYDPPQCIFNDPGPDTRED